MEPITANEQHQINSNETDVLKKKEDEHLRLQRQVRVIQTDRLHCTMGVHPQFRQQDQLLRTLKWEYINLIKDLKIARSGAHKKKDKRMKTDLKKALLFRMKTEMKCNNGTILMDQLDGLIQRQNKEMLYLRKLTNASKGELQERRYQSENRLVSTENKLETAMLRFNTIQCETKKIREEIEHMLKDRALFNQDWSRMLTALSKGKKYLTDLFESSTIAYDQRDECCKKLRSVQEKGKMDQMLQMQEMRDLQKAYDHDMKLYDFLARKGVIRINKKQEERDDEERKKKEEDVKKELAVHNKILDDINDYTEENDINKVIDAFEKTENENLGRYKLLNDYCAENEVLRRDLSRIKQELVDRRDWNESMEAKRHNQLEKLEDNLNKRREKTEELRNKIEEKSCLINKIMDEILEIFKFLECSMEPFQNLLGEKQPSVHHLNLTLNLITEKIKDNIYIAYFYERFIHKKRDPKTTSRLKLYTVYAEPPETLNVNPINLLVPSDPCPTCVEARWLSRVTDAPEKPFDNAMTMKALSELCADPAYERSDRVHALTDCRLPGSRVVLARRYM